MNYTEIANQIFESIDILVDKKLEELEFNITLICQIEEAPDSTDIIQVRYQDSIFDAYPIGAHSYQKGDQVLVLIPNNDMKRKKYILGSAVKTKKETAQIQNRTISDFSTLDILEDLAYGRAAAAKEKIKKLKGGNE